MSHSPSSRLGAVRPLLHWHQNPAPGAYQFHPFCGDCVTLALSWEASVRERREDPTSLESEHAAVSLRKRLPACTLPPSPLGKCSQGSPVPCDTPTATKTVPEPSPAVHSPAKSQNSPSKLLCIRVSVHRLIRTRNLTTLPATDMIFYFELPLCDRKSAPVNSRAPTFSLYGGCLLSREG